MAGGEGEVERLLPKVGEAGGEATTRQWPFMAADLGCSMETVMAHYLSNHVAVAYGDIFGEMVALSQALGFKVRVLAAQLNDPRFSRSPRASAFAREHPKSAQENWEDNDA